MEDIRWHNQTHLSAISLYLYKLQQSNLFCDTLIKIGVETIPLHSLILCANMQGCTCHADLEKYKESFSIKCSNFSIDIVQTLVEYMYTGGVFLKKKQLKEFLKLCEILELKAVISGLQSECTFPDDMNIVIEENNESLNFPANSLLDRFSNTAVPVTLVSNRNVGKTLEDTLMEQNASYSIEIKKEPCDTDTSLFDTSKTFNDKSVSLEQNKEDTDSGGDNDRNSNIEENETVIKSENTEMDCEQLTTSIEHAVVESQMQLTNESDSLGQRTCAKCNKVFLKIDEYVTHMKTEHTLHACPLCEWIGKRPHRLNEHMYCQHQVVNSPEKYPVKKCGQKCSSQPQNATEKNNGGKFKSPPMTTAERVRRYRERLKENPVLWDTYRRREGERKKLHYVKRSEEQKAKDRERNRVTQQKCRQKNKDLETIIKVYKQGKKQKKH